MCTNPHMPKQRSLCDPCTGPGSTNGFPRSSGTTHRIQPDNWREWTALCQGDHES